MTGRRLLMLCLAILAFTGAAAVGAWWIAEEAMSPSAAERRLLAELFGGVGLVSGFLGILLHSAVWNSLPKRLVFAAMLGPCLLYTSPSPRDQRGSRMPSSA